MRITVIGATGMVGSAITSEALGRGHIVTAASRRPDAGPEHGRLIRHALDVDDSPALAAAIASADAVVLTIRLASGDEHRLAPLTERVLDAVAAKGTRLLVIGGSAPLRTPDDPQGSRSTIPGTSRRNGSRSPARASRNFTPAETMRPLTGRISVRLQSLNRATAAAAIAAERRPCSSTPTGARGSALPTSRSPPSTSSNAPQENDISRLPSRTTSPCPAIRAEPGGDRAMPVRGATEVSTPTVVGGHIALRQRSSSWFWQVAARAARRSHAHRGSHQRYLRDLLDEKERIVKLTVSMQITLDGVAQANGGNNDALDPGFTRGGWALRFDDAEAAQYILETWRRPNAFLLGRKTYRLFEAHWGPRGHDGSFGEAISSTPKYLVSVTVTDSVWEQTTVISGDISTRVREIKEQPGGELLVVGSASLARWLLENELVDELNLIQFPVIVGEGKRFLPAPGLDFALDLIDSRVFDSGIVALTYSVGGRPEYA